MLSRKQFIFMLLLAIAGTVLAWCAQRFIYWVGIIDWLKKVELYEFIGAAIVVLAIITSVWINDRVRQAFEDQQERDLAEEERKLRVSEMIRKRQSTKV